MDNFSFNSSPIGVFDSGFGGLSILSSLKGAFPNFHFIYYADSANAPYGPKNEALISQLTYNAIEQLFDVGCELVILACNTASTVLNQIESQLQISYPNKKVVGIIEPTIKAIKKLSISNLGVLATQRTVESNVYSDNFSSITTTQEICQNWATLIEKGMIDSDEVDSEVEFHINRLLMNSNNLNAILLGCTHYPFLLPKILKFIPESVQIITQGEIMVEELIDMIRENKEFNFFHKGQFRFLTSGNSLHFDKIASKLLNEKIKSETAHTYA